MEKEIHDSINTDVTMYAMSDNRDDKCSRNDLN